MLLRHVCVPFLVACCAACAHQREAAAPTAEPVEVPPPMLDRTQRAVYNVVNGSSRWFDSLFGSGDINEGSNVSRGRVSVGAEWDERDGLRERLRMKARIPLPAFKRRLRLFVGRGDADDIVDGSDRDDVESLPTRFDDFADDDWLLGLGYGRDGDLANGWDFGAGIRLGFPVEPYVRATYHRNKALNEALLWRLQPRVFWQSQRGPGVSLNNIFDYAVNDDWLLRFWTILVAERDVEGMGWTNNVIAYQSLGNDSALAYGAYVSGESANDVPIQDYGVELRYRRRVAREWFFIELSTKLSWPREFLTETRESNVGVGIGFEMQFGEWPGREQSRTHSP